MSTENTTEAIVVRIVRLEPVHVAAALGYGEGPEGLAWGKILTWAKAKGLLEDIQSHRFFGFNNPSPSAGSPNYGYEQWITVDPSAQPEGEIKIKGFAGGLYAVTRCTGVENIFPTWQRLAAWHENSSYRHGQHQWLEEAITPEHNLPGGDINQAVFDLYMPVAE
jgi:AraC family transcriptional regulator